MNYKSTFFFNFQKPTASVISKLKHELKLNIKTVLEIFTYRENRKVRTKKTWLEEINGIPRARA